MDIQNCDVHGPYQPRLFKFAHLERWSKCPNCELAEFNRHRMQEQAGLHATRQADQRAQRLAAVGIPQRYHDAKLDSTPHAQSVRHWLAARDGGLLLLGTVGTGKTYLACAALIEAVGTGSVDAKYVTVPAYLRAIRDTWGSKDRQESDVYRPLGECSLLALDEIGASHGRESDTWRVHELIAERYDRGLPTIFISNLGPKALREAVGERAYDRMCDECERITMVGESRRKPKGVSA